MRKPCAYFSEPVVHYCSSRQEEQEIYLTYERFARGIAPAPRLGAWGPSEDRRSYFRTRADNFIWRPRHVLHA
eukprot:scaffold78623_cov76-Phaeocystis_antarctica.AAC.1